MRNKGKMMAKFCIASPHKDETWYDYRLYVNLKSMLESMGHVHQAGAKNRVYFLGGPLKKHYPKVGQFDQNANNIALIYCHFQKLHNLRQFDRVFVPSQGALDYYHKKASSADTERSSPFSTEHPIEILRPFSSLLPSNKHKPRYSCDIAFMGTPRVRPIVEAIIDIVEKHQLDLKIIGPNWSLYPGNPAAKKYWVAKSVPYNEIPLLAKGAKINLNDHHHNMNAIGAVSHKYVDLISAGGFVLCDNNVDARSWYQGETFTDQASLESLVLHYLSNEEARANKQAQQYEIVKQQTTRNAAHCIARYFLE